MKLPRRSAGLEFDLALDGISVGGSRNPQDHRAGRVLHGIRELAWRADGCVLPMRNQVARLNFSGGRLTARLYVDDPHAREFSAWSLAGGVEKAFARGRIIVDKPVPRLAKRIRC